MTMRARCDLVSTHICSLNERSLVKCKRCCSKVRLMHTVSPQMVRGSFCAFVICEQSMVLTLHIQHNHSMKLAPRMISYL